MKISDLKQPYRRMAEYLAEKNENPIKNVEDFSWYETGVDFWKNVYHLDYPPITEEIKKHFPPDFDFSGEEDVINKFRLHTRDKFKNVEIPFNFNIFNSMLKKEVKDTFYLDAKEYYTQLAKEGKFDQLPDTCEFSEPVELEVWDDELQNKRTRLILGKFKGAYLEEDLTAWNFAQLPTKKIDFSEFKTGDVVEVKYYGDEGNENIVGYIHEKHDYSIHISSKMSVFGEREIILTQNIKSITKIK